MNKWYRRMQLISTVVVLFPAAVLLYFGYLSATRPNHSAAEAAILLVCGVALPPLIYCLWSGVIWLKHGQQPGADPSSLAARLSKKPYLGFLPVGVMVGILAALGTFNPSKAAKGSRDKEDVLADMRTSCLSSAADALKQKGIDPNSVASKTRIDTYCTCIVIELQTQYSPAEFATMTAGGDAAMENDKRFVAIIKKCQQRAGGQ